MSWQVLCSCWWSPALNSAAPPLVSGKNLRIEFDQSLHSRVVAMLGAQETPMGPLVASESIRIGGKDVEDFTFTDVKQESVRDKLGAGKRYRISGTAPSLRKTVVLTVYDDFPRTIFYEVEYTNTGTSELSVEGWTNNRYSLAAGPSRNGTSFWSFEPGSYENRPVWILSLKAGFEAAKLSGNERAGLRRRHPGGGCVAAGRGSRSRRYRNGSQARLAADRDAGRGACHVGRGLQYLTPLKVAPKGTVKTFHTFVTVHRGDYFDDLTEFRRVMVKQGVTFHPAPASAFEPIWCAWDMAGPSPWTRCTTPSPS